MKAAQTVKTVTPASGHQKRQNQKYQENYRINPSCPRLVISSGDLPPVVSAGGAVLPHRKHILLLLRSQCINKGHILWPIVHAKAHLPIMARTFLIARFLLFRSRKIVKIEFLPIIRLISEPVIQKIFQPFPRHHSLDIFQKLIGFFVPHRHTGKIPCVVIVHHDVIRIIRHGLF